ncbi:hypothetical protein [Embleya sp. NPDC059237]|uniref:hypothetical protein n=1 Tax=Embleya sp. NPDC059237 TaxID=3346784 RepID=UPI0036AB6DC6
MRRSVTILRERTGPAPGSRGRAGLVRLVAIGALSLGTLGVGAASASAAVEAPAGTDPDVAAAYRCDVVYTTAYYSWITTGHSHIDSMLHAERSYSACDAKRQTYLVRPGDLRPDKPIIIDPSLLTQVRP